jgi:hypothetical protein
MGGAYPRYIKMKLGEKKLGQESYDRKMNRQTV